MARLEPRRDYQELADRWRTALNEVTDRELRALVADVEWENLPFQTGDRNLKELRERVLTIVPIQIPSEKLEGPMIAVELHRVIHEIAQLMCAENVAEMYPSV